MVTVTRGEQVHLLQVPLDLTNENFDFSDYVNPSTLGFCPVGIDADISMLSKSFSGEMKQTNNYSDLLEILNQINSFSKSGVDARVCVLTENVVSSEISFVTESNFSYPTHFVLFANEIGAIKQISKIVEQTGGSFHQWNYENVYQVFLKDLFDRLLCVRTRGGKRLVVVKHETVTPEFTDEQYNTVNAMPSSTPFTHFYFKLKFGKLYNLNYFQVIIEDVLLCGGEAIPYTRIETVKVGSTKDTLRFFDNYPLSLALNAVLHLQHEEATHVIQNAIKYNAVCKQHTVVKELNRVLPVIINSGLYAKEGTLSEMSRYLLLRHSELYGMDVFFPKMLVFTSLCSVVEKQDKKSLEELKKMDAAVVLFPCQRVLLVIYSKRIVKPGIPLRDNLKKVTHLLADIYKFNKFDQRRPQRYVVCDFLIDDPALRMYIQ
ncbi:hypothetical protein EIN_498420 [Entamoeba invadens IP1]|uniref:Uncharacterized protein n=1 Tax=Entamoeba invadens IP1 TaxID=370355 RepID=A0A0A1UDJ2_ENTIV|nr:hypothetical protein EIN_498420 [Entamoeba invadens IP1]ELP94642.1 hypothetical protein EIN_498420 [Entamoeba invadens IP1]|eukprot:XP_004261413.1 hypothetical protein EIN_498420 [Entamoeba invadens IP1]